MTHPVFKKEIIEEFSTAKVSKKATKKADSLQYEIDLDSIPILEKIELIKSLSRQIYLGAAVPQVLEEYYKSGDSFKDAPLFNPEGKNIRYFERYFMLLLTTVGWASGELGYWLGFIKDKNGISLAAHSKVNTSGSFVEALQYLRAVARLFAAIMLDKVPITKVIDPILADYAKKELTLANYLYLSYYNLYSIQNNKQYKEENLI